MIADIKKSAEQKMTKSVETLKADLGKVRTGRAHTGLLDHIQVDYYGTLMPLEQGANVTLADARTIGVQPWEKKMIPVVEKAIRDSDLGLNPVTSGDLIRVPMPALTEERRRELIKVVHHEAENARIAVRNIRRDANEHLKKLLKDKQCRRTTSATRRPTCRSSPTASSPRSTSCRRKEADLMAVYRGPRRRLAATARAVALRPRSDPAPMALFTSSTRDIPATGAVPRHVAIIMDGNGRWARQRLLPRVAGHRGVEAVRAIVRACIERGVEYLTLFAFSSENWRRPADEVSILMDLFLRALEQEVAKLHENGIRFKVVGDMSRFDPRIRDLIAAGEALTAENTRLTLTVAANYGGRWDIAQAARRYFAPHPEAATTPASSRRRRWSPFSRWPMRPSPIFSSAPAASSGFRIFCSGSSPTPSSTSPTRCGRISMRRRSTPRSTGTAGASGGSAGPANR